METREWCLRAACKVAMTCGAEIREHVRSKEADYAIRNPHARDDSHALQCVLRCVWYCTERCTSSIARRYQGNTADSREERRRASRSKAKGDSRADRVVHD